MKERKLAIACLLEWFCDGRRRDRSAYKRDQSRLRAFSSSDSSTGADHQLLIERQFELEFRAACPSLSTRFMFSS